MHFEWCVHSERYRTKLAGPRLPHSVDLLVPVKIAAFCESFITQIALIGPLTGVRSQVYHEVSFILKSFVAHSADKELQLPIVAHGPWHQVGRVISLRDKLRGVLYGELYAVVIHGVVSHRVLHQQTARRLTSKDIGTLDIQQQWIWKEKYVMKNNGKREIDEHPQKLALHAHARIQQLLPNSAKMERTNLHRRKTVRIRLIQYYHHTRDKEFMFQCWS